MMSYAEELARFEGLSAPAVVKCADACLLTLKPFVGAFLARNDLAQIAGWPDLAAALDSGASRAPRAGEGYLAAFDRIMFDADLFDGWADVFTQNALLGLENGLRFLSDRDTARFRTLCATVTNLVLLLAEDYPEQVETGDILADLARGNLTAAHDFARRVEGLYSG